MIAITYGTTGELIKLAPVIGELQRRGHEPLLLSTGQQIEQLPSFSRELGLAPADIWLARGSGGHDLDRKREIPGWAARVAVSVLRHRRDLRQLMERDGRRPFLLVHGDTMTTVLGALVGRALRVPVGHVEAGLRSGNWRDPFPEELDRRIAARLVDVHFAPGPRAVANLRREGVRGEIIDTLHNTIHDAISMTGDPASAGIDLPSESARVTLPSEPFGLVSLHRFELIERQERFTQLLSLLREQSRRQPLLFIDHSTTASVLDSAPQLAALFDERFRRIPRLPYLKFIQLLRRSAFVVTDSGGSQEECALLGIPCLVHRAVTERYDGLGESVVLSQLDLDVVREFLARPESWRVAARDDGSRPSTIIVDALAARGAI